MKKWSEKCRKIPFTIQRTFFDRVALKTQRSIWYSKHVFPGFSVSNAVIWQRFFLPDKLKFSKSRVASICTTILYICIGFQFYYNSAESTLNAHQQIRFIISFCTNAKILTNLRFQGRKETNFIPEAFLRRSS